MGKSIFIVFLLIVFSSCENEAKRKERLLKEEKEKIELETQRRLDDETLKMQEEQERIEQEALLKKEREEKIIYNKYINNSLNTGATPYSYCFGRNNSCSDYGCSQIKVRTPSTSDVLVTIKKDDKVYRHAYINSGSQYTFEFPNGVYQTFFYYGKGWNPSKIMKETDCGTLRGGFVADENFGKDFPQILNNNILEYELILQQNGNFSTSPSNPDEAL